MAFPETSILDSGVRANEGPSPDGQDFCTRADLQALGLVL
jgi:hypothetical protein